MNAPEEYGSQSGTTRLRTQRFGVAGSFRRLKMLHLANVKQKGISVDGAPVVKAESAPESESYEHLLVAIDPYWPDLLRQGSIHDRLDRSGTSTYVLKFRQRFSGARNGRQRTIYVGKRRDVADGLMREIWRQREGAGTRIPPVECQSGRESRQERPIADFLALLKENPARPLPASSLVELERLAGLERKLKEGGRT